MTRFGADSEAFWRRRVERIASTRTEEERVRKGETRYGESVRRL